jgi:hypothetical protein
MTLGAWIFLSVVLLLVVLNKPFRKFFFWATAISAVCCGLVYGYIWVADWREHRAMAREAAIQQKKQDDCNARLNATPQVQLPGGYEDAKPDVFERLADAHNCQANPEITADEAAQHRKNPQQVTIKPDTFQPLPPGYTLEQPTKKSVRPKAIEGTVTKDAVVYSESSPAGPDGQALGKVGSGTHVRIIRLDSIYGNLQVRTPNGITGWVSRDEVNY